MTAPVTKCKKLETGPGEQESANNTHFLKRILKTAQRLRSSKVRPPVPGSLCSGSGSASPSPGLKCPVWAHGLASVLERNVKVLGMAGGSVQSPRSNVRQGPGQGVG